MPDIKSALTKALSTTPLKPKSQMERIWLWLKDHPNITGARLVTELKIPQSSISSLLHQMRVRGMVDKTSQHVREDDYVTVWFVNPKMRGEYELLPKAKEGVKPAPAPKAVEEKPVPIVFLETPKVKFSIEQFTIAEAREMWVTLNKLFGEKK